MSAHYTIDVREILSITVLMLGEVSIEAIVQCVGAWFGSADYFVSLFGAPWLSLQWAYVEAELLCSESDSERREGKDGKRERLNEHRRERENPKGNGHCCKQACEELNSKSGNVILMLLKVKRQAHTKILAFVSSFCELNACVMVCPQQAA